jgi:hypothetical protein
LNGLCRRDDRNDDPADQTEEHPQNQPEPDAPFGLTYRGPDPASDEHADDDRGDWWNGLTGDCDNGV